MSAPTDLRRFRPAYPGDLLLDLTRDQLAAVGRLDARGGDLVTLDVGRLPGLVLVRHPDLVREVLVDLNEHLTKARGLRLAQQVLGRGLLTSEIPVHTRRRRLVLPAFHHQRLRAYGAQMVEAARHEGEAWAPGAPFDVAASMNRLALAIAGRTLFGADVLSSAGRVSAALGDALAAFDRAQFPFADRLTWLPLPANRRSRRARAVLDAVVYGLIDERRRASRPGTDLLAMLLEAQDEETGAGMTDEEVRDEVMTLLLAGHETTAVALAWTWALLAEHADVEARLHDEVDALDGPPSFESLDRLPYTRAVVSESMRVRPPAWIFGREAARDVVLGGVPLRRGTTLLVSMYYLHRDPRFWPDPERVDPERFSTEARAERHKFAYLPFSAGRRGCIGEQFAWAELVLALAALAQRWRLRPVGPRPRPHGSVTLRLSGPLPMVAERR